jgi:hypothetical protein
LAAVVKVVGIEGKEAMLQALIIGRRMVRMPTVTGKLVVRSSSSGVNSVGRSVNKDRVSQEIIWVLGRVMISVNLNGGKNSNNVANSGCRITQEACKDKVVIAKHVVSNGCKTINSKVVETGKPIMAMEAAIGRVVVNIGCCKVEMAGRVSKEGKAECLLLMAQLHRTLPIIINLKNPN